MEMMKSGGLEKEKIRPPSPQSTSSVMVLACVLSRLNPPPGTERPVSCENMPLIFLLEFHKIPDFPFLRPFDLDRPSLTEITGPKQ